MSTIVEVRCSYPAVWVKGKCVQSPRPSDVKAYDLAKIKDFDRWAAGILKVMGHLYSDIDVVVITPDGREHLITHASELYEYAP